MNKAEWDVFSHFFHDVTFTVLFVSLSFSRLSFSSCLDGTLFSVVLKTLLFILSPSSLFFDDTTPTNEHHDEVQHSHRYSGYTLYFHCDDQRLCNSIQENAND